MKNWAILLGTSLATTAFSCVLFSMITHRRKKLISFSLQTFDRFIFKSFGASINYKRNNKSERGKLVGFLMLMTFNYIVSIISLSRLSDETVYYLLQYFSMSFIVHLQSYQHFVYFSAVENRLRTLNEVKLNKNTRRKLKQALIQIFEVLDTVNKCFEMTLLTTFFWLYGSIFSNLQWIGTSLLGVPFIHVDGYR